jgi:hypothetical protein
VRMVIQANALDSDALLVHADWTTGSTGYFSLHAGKPPVRAVALKPAFVASRAARALVASLGQLQ